MELELTNEKISELLSIAQARLNSTEEEIEKKMIEVMSGCHSLIELCGDDPEREGMLESPYRFLRAFLEYTKGYGEKPNYHLSTTFAAEGEGLVFVRDIDFYSVCEHHFAPFFGRAHVAYLPSERITGLSKIARVVEGYSRRFQVQERLSEQIASAIDEVLKPKGVLVLLEAKHMCMCARGIQKSSSKTVTIAVRGTFADCKEQREECLRFMNI